MREPIWISDDLAITIHHRQLAEHGGQPGVRDRGLLDSALSRPKQRFTYGSGSLPELAASYAYGIAKNHPFVDGNKRTAWVAARVFLRLNGYVIKFDKVEAYLTFYKLAAGEVSEEELSAWFKAKQVVEA